MKYLDELRDALLTAGLPVFHFKAHRATGDYIVWAEDGQGGAVYADGRMQEQSITGTVDLFLREPEKSGAFLAVQNVLNGLDFCAWYLNSVQYEDDTGMTHYEWVWEMV